MQPSQNSYVFWEDNKKREWCSPDKVEKREKYTAPSADIKLAQTYWSLLLKRNYAILYLVENIETIVWKQKRKKKLTLKPCLALDWGQTCNYYECGLTESHSKTSPRFLYQIICYHFIRNYCLQITGHFLVKLETSLKSETQ